MGQLTGRSAVLLCFMILHHDFIIARNHIPYSGDKELEKDVVYDSLGPVYIGHDVAAFYDDVNSELKDDNLYSRTLSSSNNSNLTKSLQKTEGGRRRNFSRNYVVTQVVFNLQCHLKNARQVTAIVQKVEFVLTFDKDALRCTVQTLLQLVSQQISSTLTTANAKQILQAAPKAKALLGFTDDAIKASVRSSSILKVVSRSSGTVRALKFFKGAGVVLSVIGIGVDIFSIVSTVLECRDRRDKAKESLNKLKEAEQEAIKAEKEVALYCDEVTTFWKENVIPAVCSESLKQALRGVKDLVQSAVSKNEELKKALEYIDQFTERIDKAGAAKTNTLLKNLFKGLASVEFTMSCYSNKFKLIGHVINGCKMGTATLDKLFDGGIKLFPANSEECQTRSGLVYTSNENISNIVKEAAKVQGFHTKCPLNNLDLKELVCMKKREGITVEEIAEESNISEADVKRIVEKCTQELTPKEKKVVCSLRASTDWTDEVIAKKLKLSVKEVKNVSC
ncbi:uncharacterized protein LOC116290987 [Actinia tenebrosa]|uniref:Uncharacterized protein LOC116290987 n=1 Tax=Actinia tenebrosa TaxID=6105 RepID=A0A6P8HMT7_ACTTE|nr:uncharacterized protein LOC116290987 [Actinia tenebrosa]